nr:hypothetical protein [Pseudomonas sp.]
MNKSIISAAGALSLVIVTCSPAMANDVDAYKNPDTFCGIVEGNAKVIMRRLNDGLPLQSMYRDIEQIENAQLRYYLNGVATIASQFPRDADPEQFADWQQSQCLRELKGGATFPPLQGQQ